MKEYKFSFTKNVSRSQSYDHDYMVNFVKQLKNAGFTSLQVIYPKVNLQEKNPPKVNPEVYKNFGKRNSVDKYLDQRVDYPCLIIQAVNRRRDAELKIFFRGFDKSYYFDDEDYIYINQQGNSSNSIMVKANDPIDGKGLVQFVYDLLNRSSVVKSQLISIFAFFGIFFLVAEMISLASKRQQHRLLFVANYAWPPVYEVLGIVVAIGVIVLYLQKAETGLHISPPKENKFTALATDIIKGKHNKNLLVYIIVGVLIVIISQLFWELVVKRLANIK